MLREFFQRFSDVFLTADDLPDPAATRLTSGDFKTVALALPLSIETLVFDDTPRDVYSSDRYARDVLRYVFMNDRSTPAAQAWIRASENRRQPQNQPH